MTAVLREVELEAQVTCGAGVLAPNAVAGDAIWLGPDEWLVLGGREEDFADLPAAVDVSANRVCLELSGAGAADVLASAAALDLHPSLSRPAGARRRWSPVRR